MKETPKEATQENITDAMRTLGINNFALPNGADVGGGDNLENDVTPSSVEIEEEGVHNNDQSNDKPVEIGDNQQSGAGDEKNSQNDLELKRRDLQSKNDKLLSELEENRKTQALLKAQNDALMQVMASGQQPNMMNQTPQASAPQVNDKEPSIYDFIDKSEYIPEDALDPSTPSGQAYHKYQSASREYDFNKRFMQQEERRKQQVQEQAVLSAANDIATAFPEYRNPLTGQPDLQKIQRELSVLGAPSNWANLLKISKGMVGGNNQNTTQGSTGSLDKIGKRADEVTSVAKASSSGTNDTKKVPDAVKKLQEQYGSNFQLPGNIDY